MCGRFVFVDAGRIRRWMGGLDEKVDASVIANMPEPEWEPRYNISPRQSVLTVLEQDGERQAMQMRWGLQPSWAKPGQKLPLNINARDDRLTSSGMWRGPFRRSRCLIPADGFYEWTGQKGARQPWYIRLSSGDPMAFAGLYDVWRGEGEELHSCSIITTGPNELMETIHDRMPVILEEGAVEPWLDLEVGDPYDLLPLLHPCADGEMEAWPVTTAVGNTRNDFPELIERRDLSAT